MIGCHLGYMKIRRRRRKSVPEEIEPPLSQYLKKSEPAEIITKKPETEEIIAKEVST